MPDTRSNSKADQVDRLAYLSQFVTEQRRRQFEERLGDRTRHLTLVLEDIYQSHNASACLRSCEAFGVQDVHVIENEHCFEPNPDIVLGAMKWLTIHRYEEESRNTRPALEALKRRGYRVLVTCPHDGDWSLDEYDIRIPTALVFGREFEGVSPIARECADGALTIPLPGFTESLNISVAVAVCLHHLMVKLRQSEVAWQLSPDERLDLKLAWTRATIGAHCREVENRFRPRPGTAVNSPEGPCI